MEPIESLALSANQWQFLSNPDRYVAASQGSNRPLVPESTRRQFVTARDILIRLNGSHGEDPRRGILLADDVGLGKTTVAALVAWVVASAGQKRGVRILAPNDVMMRRWVEELHSHVVPLQQCAPKLNVSDRRVKVGQVRRLSAGSVQVVKHSYAASDFNLACDLLIVDEAHRAKGEGTAFSAALKRQKKHAARVLILTATPFSIKLQELERMLGLIGADVVRPVRAFSRALDDLYSSNTARNPEHVADRLATRAEAAVDALNRFVIRHGIDDLPDERGAFGERNDWNIVVPPASAPELELMLRMDRALRLAQMNGSGSTRATNDPRFHVGWDHVDTERARLQRELILLTEPARAVVQCQLAEMQRLRSGVGVHSKMSAVAAEVRSVVEQGERVLLFCHHHATARELTVHLDTVLPVRTAPRSPDRREWERCWERALDPAGDENERQLRATFIRWLCGDPIRAQVWNWLGPAASGTVELEAMFRRTPARDPQSRETIAGAAKRLYETLHESKSSQAVLKAAAGRPDLLPGASGTSRVLGVCTPSETGGEQALFVHNQQPDTVIAIFNSPFGPDVLVVTDKLSEGIDLHRYCRHLVHYELDPSPIRTVQRNGRLRRVNSWAAVTGRPIRYAYPAFPGTRDHRLVQIMKKRIDSFSLLLGGVQDFDIDQVHGADETWRTDVITRVKGRLAAVGGRLKAKNFGGST
jgi:ERCC4-related helicase